MARIMVAVLALLVAVWSGGPAAAGQCGYDYCWGAVAIGPNGAYGYSHSWKSQDAALKKARNGCKGNCTIVQTFYNSCAAIAVADNGGWGWGYDSSRELAENTAMSFCMDQGRNCGIRVWACSK